MPGCVVREASGLDELSALSERRLGKGEDAVLSVQASRFGALWLLAEPLAVATDAGALGVVVSGSGPTVAALARSRQHALAIAAAMTAADVVDDVATAIGNVPGARVVTAGV